MPVDPQVQSLLDAVASAGPAVPISEQSIADARQAMAGFAALAGPGPEVARVFDAEAPGPNGAVPVRVYLPEGDGPLPVLVWFHGGGWVVGRMEDSDAIARRLAVGAGVAVVNVEYRLAPEHPYPAPLGDCLAAIWWAAEQAPSWGADPARLAVGGESAGGNLAAAAALRARDENGPAIAFQLLVYPVTDGDLAQPSMAANGEGYLLTEASVQWFWAQYLGPDGDRHEPYVSVLHAPDLAGLPPALVLTAEYDPLRDEGERYAERLRAAGVEATASRYDGQIHAFFSLPFLDASTKAVDEACAALRTALT